MNRLDKGALSSWLGHIRDVHRLHLDELSAIDNMEARYRRLVELNVQEQCINLFKMAVIQRSLRATGFPRIHGLVYDLKHGLLRELNVDFKSFRGRYGTIYEFYDDDNESHADLDAKGNTKAMTLPSSPSMH